jgi:type VI secretion system protein ImpE
VNATELFKAGRLADAVDAQIKEVKSDPADQAKRLFLFELLAFTGDLERAKRQIDVVQYGEPGLDAAVLGYRKLLDAEESRRRLVKDGVKPQFLSEPPEHARLRLEAINALRNGKPSEALALLGRADEVTPTLQGQFNGKPFSGIRDCDDLFASVLEVFTHGVYFWVPFEEIESLTAKPPEFPRDLLWFPARLQSRSGAAGDVFLPTLYTGSHEHSDDQARLGRMTDWKTNPGGPVTGIGMRTLLVNDDGVHLPEFRDLQIG